MEMRETVFVAYYRVSTQKQGRSGLGLEAQKSAVESFVIERGGRIVKEFTEVESGKVRQRPQLEEALSAARRHRATLIVGKLDRLSRKVLDLLQLLNDSRVPIRFADAPDADETMITVMAAFAQREADLISKRTKDALKAAKARGVKLGSHREGFWTTNRDVKRKAALETGRITAEAVRKNNAAQFHADVAPLIISLRSEGMTLQGIKQYLADENIPARRGGEWSVSQIHNILRLSGEITNNNMSVRRSETEFSRALDITPAS